MRNQEYLIILVNVFSRLQMDYHIDQTIINYSYRQEMISDGIENCLQYVHNFDPDKSKNPFSYFTQIIYLHLFVEYKKKKQAHIKNKMIEKRSYDTFTTMEGDDTPYQVRGFDPDLMLPDEDVYKPKKKETVQKTNGLENFMELTIEDNGLTDTHFGARNDNLNFNDYFYEFYEGVFFPYLQQNNIKHCIHLGDLMDRRKYVSYRILKDFRERFIQPFLHLEIDLHILVGNHDIYFRNTNDVNSLQELLGANYKNIHIYPEAQEVDFGGFPILMMKAG